MRVRTGQNAYASANEYPLIPPIWDWERKLFCPIQYLVGGAMSVVVANGS